MKTDIYKNLDPRVAQFLIKLAAQNNPPINTLPPVQARAVLDDLQKASYDSLQADIQDLDIPYQKNKTVKIRIVRPQNISKNLPAILYFHGGGWILGDAFTHDRIIRQLAYSAQAAVVFVSFTPSPEADYSTILEQAYGTLEYVTSHGAQLHLDPLRLAVVGDSAGGNIAAALTLLAKERKGPKIDYQVLFYPVTNANLTTQSYTDFAQDFWLTKAAMAWFWDAYAPDLKSRSNHLVSPLKATIEQLRNLPPALIINAENDVLRDEGQAYARKLMQAGVDVTPVEYLGTIHDFILLDPLKDTAATKSALALAGATLKEVLHT